MIEIVTEIVTVTVTEIVTVIATGKGIVTGKGIETGKGRTEEGIAAMMIVAVAARGLSHLRPLALVGGRPGRDPGKPRQRVCAQLAAGTPGPFGMGADAGNACLKSKGLRLSQCCSNKSKILSS